MEHNTNLLKTLHAIMAIAALILFLSAPFISFGGKYEITGIDLLERMDDDDSWMVLFLVTPILAALSAFSSKRILRGLLSLAQFLPILLLLAAYSDQKIEFATGGILYCLLALGTTVIAFAGGSQPSGEGDSGEAESTAPRQPSDEVHAQDSRIHRKAHVPEASSTVESKVRNYDRAKLTEIVNNAPMYKPELVQYCRQELEIREAAAKLMPQVKAMADDELHEKLNDRELYSAELLRACQKELSRRRRLQQEEQARQAEQERLEREKRAEEERLEQQRREEETRARRAAAWKRWRPYVAAAAAVIVLASAILYLNSDTHHFRRGKRLAARNKTEKAIKCLSTISDLEYKNFSEARYLLYKQYLATGDLNKASNALADAIKPGKWEYPPAYREYAEYCLQGDFTPYIPKSKLQAASIYSLSPAPDDQVKAGQLYFEVGRFIKARETLEAVSWNSTAKGYLGLIYHFALGSTSRDDAKAWSYLSDAPDVEPFVAHKGDLALLLRRGRNGHSTFSSIELANSCYAIAVQLDPTNQAYTRRYEVTSKIIAAQEKHAKISYWDRGSKWWSSYTAGNCSYIGEISGVIGNNYSNGWGCFTWEDSDEIRLGYYTNGRNNGPGLDVRHNEILIGKLTGTTGTLTEGYRVWYDGDVWVGSWKGNHLLKGKKYDINGNLIETVK